MTPDNVRFFAQIGGCFLRWWSMACHLCTISVARPLTALEKQATEPCPIQSYKSTKPCSRPNWIAWSPRRSPRSSTGCWTLQADEITGAARYERSGSRKAYRSGHYERDLTLKGRENGGEGAQAQGGGLRVGGHRTLPEAGGVGRGSPDRHVSGGRVHEAGR